MRIKFTKLTSAFLALIMIFGIFTIIPLTASAATSGDFKYEVLDDGTAKITEYTGSETDLTIPSTLDGYAVTYIGTEAFSESNIVNVIIAEGVKILENYAFKSCSNLKKVILPNTVTKISTGAFSYCSSLVNINIPESVNCIYDVSFSECKSLKSITIPDGVTDIKGIAFYRCTSLERVSIPDSVTNIGNGAFANCKKLADITIPDSVSSIGARAFADTIWYNNQPTGVVYAGKVAYTYKGEMPENTSITLKDGINGIAEEAFAKCKNLVSITIPNCITKICYSTFNSCTGLTSITLPDSVKEIGTNAFSGCTNLKNITIPNSVVKIDFGSFQRCTSLTEITIPDSITSIDELAFLDCTNLHSITIPYSVKNIGWASFGYICDVDSIFKKVDFTIYGYTGSEAERYAKEEDFTFISLGDAPKPKLGDVNGDGKISIDDATDIQKYAANMLSFTEEQKLLADVDKDGKISIDDVTLIQKHLAGLAVIE